MRIAPVAAALVMAVASLAVTPVAPAHADGMPRPAPSAAPVDAAYPAPEQLFYNWTGVYFGGHIGATNALQSDTFSVGPEPFSASTTRFVGGGQAGVQIQLKSFVFGGEWLYSWTDADIHHGLTTGYMVSSRLRDLMLVTGKFGYAYQNYLFYAKGGYATAGLDYKTTGTGLGSASGRGEGWVGGLGVNYAVAPKIILGAEYNYVHLSPGGVTLGANTLSSGGIDLQNVMLRLDFKFGG